MTLAVGANLSGCLLNRTIPNRNGNQYVGVCQSGTCKTAPWCATPLGAFVADQTINDAEFTLCEEHGNRLARQRRIIDRDAIPRDVWCVGPTADPGLDLTPDISTISGAGDFLLRNPDVACYFSDSRIPASIPRPLACNQVAEVPGSCDFVAGPGGNWGRRLNCPHKAVFGFAIWPIDFPVAPGLTNAQKEPIALARGWRYQSALCNLYSAPAARDVDWATIGRGSAQTASLGFLRGDEHLVANINDLPPDFCPTRLFAQPFNTRGGLLRRCGIWGDGEPPARNPALPLDDDSNPINIDPGLDVDGYLIDVEPNASTLVVKTGSAQTTVSIRGTVAIRRQNSGAINFSVTDFAIDQTAASTFEGHTFVDATLRTVAVWSGAIDGNGEFFVDRTTVPVVVTTLLDGERAESNFVPSSNPTGTFALGSGVFSFQAVFTDGGRTFTLNLLGHVRTARPSVGIAASPNDQSGGNVQLECNSAQGADYHPIGVTTNTDRISWDVSLPDHEEYSTSLTPTFQIPVLGATAPPIIVSLLGFRNPWYTASDVRRVRVVDSLPPVILSTKVEPVCKWGRSAGESGGSGTPNNPQLCAYVTGNFSDVCSNPIGVEFVETQVINFATNAVVSTTAYAQTDNPCLRPSPLYLDAQLSQADYIIRYRVRDARGNATATRTWRGYFTAGSATSTCDLPADVHTISDAP